MTGVARWTADHLPLQQSLELYQSNWNLLQQAITRTMSRWQCLIY